MGKGRDDGEGVQAHLFCKQAASPPDETEGGLLNGWGFVVECGWSVKWVGVCFLNGWWCQTAVSGGIGGGWVVVTE